MKRVIVSADYIAQMFTAGWVVGGNWDERVMVAYGLEPGCRLVAVVPHRHFCADMKVDGKISALEFWFVEPEEPNLPPIEAVRLEKIRKPESIEVKDA